MPNPVLYTQALAVAAVVSALCVLATGWTRTLPSASRMNFACVLGLGAGVIAGYRVLQLRCAWPPINGLDRLLTIVLPATFFIELLACWPQLPQWLARGLRLILVASCGLILLHGSVYLGGPHSAWTATGTFGLLLLSSSALAIVWWSMSRLSRRSSGSSILLAIALATQAAAINIMLAGYITGGAAALPLTAALIGTSIAAIVCRAQPASRGAVAMGVVGLFGLLFVGRFYGGLSTSHALAMLLAPMLCWVTEAPQFRQQLPRHRAILNLLLVAIPLLVVLILAKLAFDRDMAPLIGSLSQSPEVDSNTQSHHGRVRREPGSWLLTHGSQIQLICVPVI